jgi:hypothetical protein
MKLVCQQLVWNKNSEAFPATEFPDDVELVLELLVHSPFGHLTRLLARETVNCRT